MFRSDPPPQDGLRTRMSAARALPRPGTGAKARVIRHALHRGGTLIQTGRLRPIANHHRHPLPDCRAGHMERDLQEKQLNRLHQTTRSRSAALARPCAGRNQPNGYNRQSIRWHPLPRAFDPTQVPQCDRKSACGTTDARPQLRRTNSAGWRRAALAQCSWPGVSIAQGRTSRSRSSASSEASPASIIRRRATMPERPHPPRQ